jgi:UDP-glucose 4-epimerase
VDVGNFIADNTKLRSLGWKQKIQLEEGVKSTINFFEDKKM